MDMNLRIILVIVGALIIIGIIMVDRIKHKKRQDSPYERFDELGELDLPSMRATQERPDHDELDGLPAGYVPDAAIAGKAKSGAVDLRPFTSMDETVPMVATARPQERVEQAIEPVSEPLQLTDKDIAPTQILAESPPAPVDLQSGNKAARKMILSLLILAQKGEQFRGSQIKMVMKELGFVYGNMDIYHQMAGDEPLLSIANVLEPGIFKPDPDDLASLQTPGLVLFAQLPAIYSGDELVERWYSTAKKLKASLNGRLTDMYQQPLGDGYIDRLRTEAEAFGAIVPDSKYERDE